jgi:hypothetical protein
MDTKPARWAAGRVMSSFGVETPEERRRRYLRLARAATETAAKTPLHGAKEMYLKLADAWLAMADEHQRDESISYTDDAGSEGGIPPGEGRLNAKLKENP